ESERPQREFLLCRDARRVPSSAPLPRRQRRTSNRLNRSPESRWRRAFRLDNAYADGRVRGVCKSLRALPEPLAPAVAAFAWEGADGENKASDRDVSLVGHRRV